MNCVVADRFDEARKEAQATDQLIKSGTLSEETLAKEKPFLGVPFTTKDCIAVKGKTNLCYTESNSMCFCVSSYCIIYIMSYIHNSNDVTFIWKVCHNVYLYTKYFSRTLDLNEK